MPIFPPDPRPPSKGPSSNDRNVRILVVASYYRPDGGAAAPLYTMLCEALARRGHRVEVITTVPHYPSGCVPREFRGRLPRRTVENGVLVRRIPLPSVTRANLAARLLQFALFQAGAAWEGLKPSCDVLLTHSPALEVGLPFSVLTVLRRKPAVYSVHDVYPDVGIKLGIFRHAAIVQTVEALERFCLKHSARVRILSKSFAPSVQRLGVPEAKLDLIYDWVDPQVIRSLPRDNDFAGEHDLTGRFVVMYAGNMGFVQGLDSVLKAAEWLRDQPDICFVFVGDGSARKSLTEMAGRRGLPNVRFVAYQPRERMAQVFAAADVSLISLRAGAGFGALPSKLFSIFSSGRPVIAAVDPECDAWNVVEASRAGMCVPPESPGALKDAILALKADPSLRESMGSGGRRFAEAHHSPEKAAEAFEGILLQAIKGTRRSPLERAGDSEPPVLGRGSDVG